MKTDFDLGVSKPIDALIIGARSIVFDYLASEKLYKEGFYGKPFGIKKPKITEEIRAPLELSMLETMYLCEKGVIRPFRMDSYISCDEVYSYAKSIDARFDSLYIVYKDLREKGYVVRSGMKFGVDFTVYELGPGLEHAPYLVQVKNIEEDIDPIEIVRIGRLSHSVRKTLMFAIVSGMGVKYIAFKWIKI